MLMQHTAVPMSVFIPSIASAFFPQEARHSTFFSSFQFSVKPPNVFATSTQPCAEKTATTDPSEVFCLGSLGSTIQHSLSTAETEEPKKGFSAVPTSETSWPQQFSNYSCLYNQNIEAQVLSDHFYKQDLTVNCNKRKFLSMMDLTDTHEIS